MAEVLGIIASGIAVGQATAALTSSLLKLKSLWNELRDVPEDLLHLLRELEVVYAVLEETDNQILTPPVPRSLLLAMQLMNDGAKELKCLVEELQDDSKGNRRWKGKIGAAKVVLKRDQVKRLKSRLKTCIRLLNLVKQCQFSAMLEKQPEMLALQLTTLSQTAKDTGCEESSLETSNAKSHSPQCDTVQNGNSLRWKLRLLQRQWYLNLHRSQAGWNIVIQVFHVLPDSSEVTDLIRLDNVNLLREHLRDGKVSTYSLISDRCGHPHTLLTIAVRRGSLRVCRLLLDKGAKVFERSIETASGVLRELHVNTAILHASPRMSPFPKSLETQQLLLSLAELLLHKVDPESDLEAIVSGTYGYPPAFRGTLALFKLLQTSLYSDYFELTFEDRALVANSMSARGCNSPDLIRYSLGCIDNSCINGMYGTELFGNIASRLAYSLNTANYFPSRGESHAPLYTIPGTEHSIPDRSMFREDRYPLCGWEAFVRQLINAGANPNIPTRRGTILMRVISGAFFTTGLSKSIELTADLNAFLKKPERAAQALMVWLRILKDCHIDLEEYGKNEVLVMDERRHGEVMLQSFWELGQEKLALPLHIIGIKYGPTPEDWKLWFSDPTDQLAGEFWDMIEHPERRMPGAWDEFEW